MQALMFLVILLSVGCAQRPTGTDVYPTTIAQQHKEAVQEACVLAVIERARPEASMDELQRMLFWCHAGQGDTL